MSKVINQNMITLLPVSSDGEKVLVCRYGDDYLSNFGCTDTQDRTTLNIVEYLRLGTGLPLVRPYYTRRTPLRELSDNTVKTSMTILITRVDEDNQEFVRRVAAGEYVWVTRDMLKATPASHFREHTDDFCNIWFNSIPGETKDKILKSPGSIAELTLE